MRICHSFGSLKCTCLFARLPTQWLDKIRPLRTLQLTTRQWPPQWRGRTSWRPGGTTRAIAHGPQRALREFSAAALRYFPSSTKKSSSFSQRPENCFCPVSSIVSFSFGGNQQNVSGANTVWRKKSTCTKRPPLLSFPFRLCGCSFKNVVFSSQRTVMFDPLLVLFTFCFFLGTGKSWNVFQNAPYMRHSVGCGEIAALFQIQNWGFCKKSLTLRKVQNCSHPPWTKHIPSLEEWWPHVTRLMTTCLLCGY